MKNINVPKLLQKINVTLQLQTQNETHWARILVTQCLPGFIKSLAGKSLLYSSCVA